MPGSSFSIRAVSVEFGETEISLRQHFPLNLRTIEKTGIDTVFQTKRTAVELAASALNRLFGESDLRRDEVDCLIFVTQSPSYFLPSGACLLQDMCDVSKSAMAFDVGQGCSGFVQALSIAATLTRNFANTVIVCADNYRSKLDPKDYSTSMLFSDAASAVWINSEPSLQVRAESHFTDGSGKDFLFQAITTGESRELLHMSGADVLLFTKNQVPKEIDRALNAIRLTPSDISKWIVHQASKLVLDAIENRMSIHGRLERNLSRVGNSVSSSIPILLKEQIHHLDQGPLLLCGFGVGLSIATMILEPLPATS